MTKDEALKLALEALEEALDAIESWGSYASGYFQVKHDWEGDIENTKASITSLRQAIAEAEQPEFTKHTVETTTDWSEWVCPDPKSYLMKCCDCGLVHEAQFGVVRYKSETEREDCDKVDDPNLQAVFRMRRHEAWEPEDTAHRAGGLPMEQAQSVAWMHEMLRVQGCDGTWNCDPYMHGMYNGMEYMLAMVENREPVFRDAPDKWLNTLPPASIASEAHGIKENT